MARIRDDWGKLVHATLQREKLRQLARENSLSSTCSSQFSISSPLPETPILNLFNTSLTYEDIMHATRHFSDQNLIKQGHSGELFIARFQQFPFPVVVKRIDTYSEEHHFSIEMDFFSRVSGHSRFINLLGSSSKGKDKFMVYRYYSKGDLSKFLFTKPDERQIWWTPLDWDTRIKIAIGTAEGLAFLHHNCDPPIAHGDVHASSILLDDDFEVRLGSLSQATPQDVDFMLSNTRRYTSVTCADDVYCFGKVLLELVTGKFGISSSSDDTLEKLWKTTLCYADDKEFVSEILDQTLHVNTDIIVKGRDMAIIARSCLNPRPPLRPLMREVLRSLEKCMNL